MDVDNLQLISLDLETSGLTPGVHVPLSIGAVKIDRDSSGIVFKDSFYLQLEWDSLVVDPKALRINQLDIVNPPSNRIMCPYDYSVPAKEGLAAFADWLDVSNTTPVLALGKNVGSFDLPMLKSVWTDPWPFHYRSIDLNTLFITLSELTNLAYDEVKNNINSLAWVAVKKQYPTTCEHHALYDAIWNVYAWKECLRWLSTWEVRTRKVTEI